MPQQFSLYAPVVPTLSQKGERMGAPLREEIHTTLARGESHAESFRIPVTRGRINCLNEDAL
jgi:hypothetical protein